MTTTVASIEHGVVTLSDGTAFEIGSSAIEEYGIAVGDQAIVVQPGQAVTIFHLQHHKADIRLLPGRNGLPMGQVSAGTLRKPVDDPACPFANHSRHFL